jgi:nitrogen fixation/metabolism regulation signal transduction histidine kinase
MNQKSASFSRTHFFIDRKFQGRYMMTFLVPMVVLLLFMLFTLYFASMTIIDTTTRIIKKDIENKVSLELQDQVEPNINQYKSTLNGINLYVRTFSSNKEFKQSVLSSLLWVFGIGMILVIIQIVFLTVFFSHKIAGPVYRLEKVCHNMISGNYTDQIHLRKGDEMQNLAVLLNEVIRKTRERMNSFLNAKSDEERKEIVKNIQI